MDIVGAQEIAQRLGVQRATVDQWRQRGLLPDPDFTLSGRPGWYWTSVLRWATVTGRYRPAPGEDVRSDTPAPESALERELRLSREADR